MKAQTKQFVIDTLNQKGNALQQQIDALRAQFELTAAALAQMELEECND
jgi:hypothetical protein